MSSRFRNSATRLIKLKRRRLRLEVWELHAGSIEFSGSLRASCGAENGVVTDLRCIEFTKGGVLLVDLTATLTRYVGFVREKPLSLASSGAQ